MVSTVIAVPQQVQDVWLQKVLEKYWISIAKSIGNQICSKMKAYLQTAFEVKALDVEAVSVGSPHKSVLEVRHDLLPGHVGHDDDHLPPHLG